MTETKKGHLVLRAYPDEVESIKEYAASLDTTMNTFVRDAIMHVVDNHIIPGRKPTRERHYKNYLSDNPLYLMRRETGRTQADVAKELGCVQTALSTFENGRLPGMPMLKRMAKLYGVSVGYLVDAQMAWIAENKEQKEQA
jgi:DNA-binding XRE family transcriptional regulator